MKIGFILYHQAIVSGDSNGVKKQARLWEKGLTAKGHIVDELNQWNSYNWATYDVIHIFGTGLWLYDLVKGIFNYNQNIVLSPIIDSNQSKFKYRLASYVGIEKLRLFSSNYILRKSLPYLKKVFVRSDYEGTFFKKSFSVEEVKICKVELSYENFSEVTEKPKEDFCLHISSIYQERKNVVRLIQAAKKYNFKLVLAGSKGSEEEFEIIKNTIGNNSETIKVLGFINEDEMVDLFLRAKVFALPSLKEGVGLVALNAAFFGCEIVITNIGAPKEYYNGMANLVDPFNVDSIGTAVLKSFENKSGELKEYIKEKYSIGNVTDKLEIFYMKLLEKKK